MNRSYKLKKYIWLCTVLLAACWSCKPKMMVTKGLISEANYHDSIPYHLASHQEPSPDLLLFLPPELDSFKLKSSPLHEKLFRQGYDILIVDKNKETPFYQRKSLDYRELRLEDILLVFSQLKARDSISYERLTVMGMEEGAQLASEVAVRTNANQVVFINACSFSPLLRMEQIGSKQDSLTAAQAQYFHRHFGLDSIQDLRVAVNRVRSTKPTDFVLGKYPNRYWRSYDEQPFYLDCNKIEVNMHWIYFKNHPLCGSDEMDLMRSMVTPKAGIDKMSFHPLPGNGDLSQESSLRDLQQTILSITEPIGE